MLLDLVFCRAKLPCFHCNYVMKLTGKDKRWNCAVMGRTIGEERNAMATHVSFHFSLTINFLCTGGMQMNYKVEYYP